MTTSAITSTAAVAAKSSRRAVASRGETRCQVHVGGVEGLHPADPCTGARGWQTRRVTERTGTRELSVGVGGHSRHRGARDRRHGAQHRPAAPGDPRRPAAQAGRRRRADRLGRADRRLHAPRRREALRGPRLPPDHRAGQPPRLALGLRQRARRRACRRATVGHGGPTAGGVGPHAARRAQPGAQPPDVPRFLPAGARRDHADLLLLPRARGAPGRDGGGLRRPDALHVQPGRRPQGGPAGRLAAARHRGHHRRPRSTARPGKPVGGQRDPARAHPWRRRPPGRGRGVVRRLRSDRPGQRTGSGPAPRRALPGVRRAVRPGRARGGW